MYANPYELRGFAFIIQKAIKSPVLTEKTKNWSYKLEKNSNVSSKLKTVKQKRTSKNNYKEFGNAENLYIHLVQYFRIILLNYIYIYNNPFSITDTIVTLHYIF